MLLPESMTLAVVVDVDVANFVVGGNVYNSLVLVEPDVGFKRVFVVDDDDFDDGSVGVDLPVVFVTTAVVFVTIVVVVVVFVVVGVFVVVVVVVVKRGFTVNPDVG
jgi:hypothetical protein